MFITRTDEPSYAKLPEVPAPDKNVHGNDIDLIACSTVAAGTSLFINADAGVGDTVNRNKQHGFHFTADNCIGCHACEAACSEKNDLPPHLSFRSVGYVEGGSYPSFTRMNISMACNHCDDPVCLKGCPTNAYTKHSEYGAVLQDPETCFGCGYCTWVCPYNAPQLDHAEGHVQKCNMCVDRLEVGLKPACVSACVGNALDFGVIETTPANREQAKTTIPGFPNPEISKPNIRFQQTKSMPREFTRTDSAPIKYHHNESLDAYTPAVDIKAGTARQWNLSKLSSRENPLVIFTLVTQAVIGAFSITFMGAMFGLSSLQTFVGSGLAAPFLLVLTLLQAFVLFLSTQHLGKPLRFYRGFNNLRYSPLSKEALAVSIFFGFLPVLALLSILDHGFMYFAETGLLAESADFWLRNSTQILAVVTVAIALIGLYYMHRIYRIKARPFWDHWQVLSSFFGTMFSVGAVLTGLIYVPLAIIDKSMDSGLILELLPFLVIGLAIEAIGHVAHARYLKQSNNEAMASLQVLKTNFGKTYRARNLALGLCLVVAGTLALYSERLPDSSWLFYGAIGLLAGLVLLTSLVGRALFYVIVIPTTMPGAFFWKNKGFEEHARQTGLAKLPQVGVLEFDH